MSKQAALEAEMARLGRERYQSRRKKAEAAQLETTTPAGQWLLANAVTHLGEAIEAWVKLAEERPGRAHKAVAYFKLLPPNLTAALVARCILDAISHRKSATRTAMQVAGMLEDECRFMALAESDPKVWSKVKKRVNEYMGYSVKRRNIVALMNRMEHPFVRWTQSDKLQIGTVAIELMAQSTGLIEIANRRTIFGKTRTEITASDQTMRWLEQAHERQELLTPVFLPCVEPPRDWTAPTEGGFHTDEVHKRPLVKVWDRRYLDELEVIEMPELYEAVNRIQRSAFTINTWLLEVLNSYWEAGSEIAGLPRRQNLEVPPKPHDIEDNEEARREWRKAAAAVHDENSRTVASRLAMDKILQLAQDYSGKLCWFVAQLDWRSRAYQTSLHLHPQGPDYAKALLRFGSGKVLDETGVYWLKVHGANCYGLTKASFGEREAWVDKNHAAILEVAKDPYQHQDFWSTCDEPWQFLAWAKEYSDWFADPTGFQSSLPIALDATQSGVQVLSLALRDPIGAGATNCTDSDRPQDLYAQVADKTVELLEADDSELAAMWLEFGLDRKATKRIVMTRVYNAQLFSAMGYVREWAVDKAGTEDFIPVQNDHKACLYLARKIWEALDHVISGAQQAMAWFSEVADICVKAETPIRWTTPIGYPVKQDYRRYRMRSIKTRIGSTIRQHKLREETDKFDRRKMINGLAPNWVHSMDAALMYRTILEAGRRGVEDFAVVHDSFAVRAADAGTLHASITNAAAEMFAQDWLAEFKREVESYLPPDVRLPELPPYGSLDPACVRVSKYFFS